MSALRARRRFLAWERYEARCVKLDARTSVRRQGFSTAHAVWFSRAMYQGRWAPNGIRYVRLTGWKS
jgi:hypothetical protein